MGLLGQGPGQASGAGLWGTEDSGLAAAHRVVPPLGTPARWANHIDPEAYGDEEDPGSGFRHSTGAL